MGWWVPREDRFGGKIISLCLAYPDELLASTEKAAFP